MKLRIIIITLIIIVALQVTIFCSEKSRTYVQKGITNYNLGNKDAGYEYMYIAMETDPNDYAGYYGMLYMLYYDGKYDDALLFGLKALKTYRDYGYSKYEACVQLYIYLGNTFKSLTMYEDALKVYSYAFKMSYDIKDFRSEVHVLIAQLYIEIKDYETAFREVQKAKEYPMKDPDLNPYQTESLLYFYRNDFDNSIRSINKAIETTPANRNNVRESLIDMKNKIINIKNEVGRKN